MNNSDEKINKIIQSPYLDESAKGKFQNDYDRLKDKIEKDEKRINKALNEAPLGIVVRIPVFRL